jgi:hypothetical protein
LTEEELEKRSEREQKYVYDKSAITLETVVPELPKKHETIAKPLREDLDKKLDDIDDQIDKMHEHFVRKEWQFYHFISTSTSTK